MGAPRIHAETGELAKILALLLAGLIASGAVYSYGLDRVPAYLTLDEAHFAVHAESIARTGRNLNGQLLPALINLEDPAGEPINVPWGSTHYLPFGIYLIAGALTVLPISEAAVRAPSALLGGVVNIALLFAVALALFRRPLAAFAAAAVLALSPANVILSRVGIDSVCQPPFVLAALWCSLIYARKPDWRVALLCGAVLGCGIYAYVTSIVFMPFYLAMFWFISWRAGVLDRRTIAWSVAGFVAALMPMALWLSAHPDAARSVLLQYNRADPGSSTLMQSFANGGLLRAVSDTMHIYWSYFDPGFLFVQGGNARTLSTGEHGVFPLAVAVLAAIGLVHSRHSRLAFTILLIGLVVSPLPAVIKGAPYAIQRASGLLIYISLCAGLGVAALGASRSWVARGAAAIAIVLTIWQFAGFYRSYHTTYRIASALTYDPTAFRESAAIILDLSEKRAPAAVYLPMNYYDVSAKWRFHVSKHHRSELLQVTKYYARPDALAGAPARSVALVTSAEIPPGWSPAGVATDVAGEQVATVIWKE